MARPNALIRATSRGFLILVSALVWAGSSAQWIAPSALAQATGGPAQGTAIESSTPPVLSPEKQALIREQAKRGDLPVVTLNEPARMDMTIPDEVELLALPQDVSTETPSTTSYRYLITSDVIAVVEPQSRKVIQLISR